MSRWRQAAQDANAKPVLTMAASRGCPYRCDYCSLINTGGKVFRRRDPIKVVDEYEYLVDRYGVKQIGFIDPIFPLVKKDLQPFCEELVKRGAAVLKLLDERLPAASKPETVEAKAAERAEEAVAARRAAAADDPVEALILARKVAKSPDIAKNDANGKFCPNCGAQIKPGDRFCPVCGQKL